MRMPSVNHRLFKLAIGVSAICAAAIAASLPLNANAARPWIAPSASFIEAGDGPVQVVTIDAAVSEDLFEFDRMGLQLDGVSIVAPDGSNMAPEALGTGRRRNGFEFKPTQKGTYRISNVSDMLMASYKVGGEMKRWRGPASALAREVPADAQEVQVTRLLSRAETFVTYGSAGGKALVAANSGLEAVPLTNPTDLSSGDVSTFRLLNDGKPVADADVTIIRGGGRYRYKLGEIALKTDADGKFSVTWADAGRYWIGASVGDRGPGGTAAQPALRASYSATVEVLPK